MIDTVACPNSLNIAIFITVDIGIENCKTKLMNKNKKVLHRPGHHAEKNKAMGFGVFNNVAISADYALRSKKFEKILIIDFDVHHGTPTYILKIIQIFYASSHQYPYYPGTGDLAEKGCGNIFNCPLPANCDSKLFQKLFSENIVDKINQNFDLLYFSAGFDAHVLDPLASINLEDEDFFWITKKILDKFANNIPIISVLEGGYDMKGLYNGLNNHLKVLQDYSYE